MSLLRLSYIARPIARPSLLSAAAPRRHCLATQASPQPTPSVESDPIPSGPVTRTISLTRRYAQPSPTSPAPPTSSPASSTILRASEPYTVSRTPTRGLPVYQLSKSGGNLKLTRVRKLGGALETLRKQLEETLRPEPEYVKINPLTGHIIIKVCFF